MGVGGRGEESIAVGSGRALHVLSGERGLLAHQHRLGFALHVIGFLLVDFLFFHDLFKAGEAVTFAQYLTGVLSIPVVVIAMLYLLRGTSTLQN